MYNAFEGLEKVYPASKYIFDTSGQIIGQIVRGSQKPKIMKNANFDENSIFHTLAKIAQNDVIWQEMDT